MTPSIPRDKEVMSQNTFYCAQLLPGPHFSFGLPYPLLSVFFSNFKSVQCLGPHVPSSTLTVGPSATVNSRAQPAYPRLAARSYNILSEAQPSLLESLSYLSVQQPLSTLYRASFTPRGVDITFSRLKGVMTFNFRVLWGHEDHRGLTRVQEALATLGRASLPMRTHYGLQVTSQ
ncbi:hypothetical protein CRG98_016832 [Punica granatum]|uniref:Uncharacterized protein n=1 Tax=Punica granatum TaxID=22663 RepID=A0A2I0K3S6_PUNGR|nr:hypothetical protein CRG98_016832 [Punica granatum]